MRQVMLHLKKYKVINYIIMNNLINILIIIFKDLNKKAMT